MPAALLTGRKQFPFHETIKIKLSVNSPKVTVSNLITSAARAVNPTAYHLIQKKPESRFPWCVCSFPRAPGWVLPPADLVVRKWQECSFSTRVWQMPSWQQLLPGQPTGSCGMCVSSREFSLAAYTLGGIRTDFSILTDLSVWPPASRTAPATHPPPVTVGPARENPVRCSQPTHSPQFHNCKDLCKYM